MSARASSPSQMEDILSRMEALETASKNMREEMFSLQKENIVLRSDLLKGQRESMDMKKELQSLRKQMKVLNRRVDDGKTIEMARKAGEKKLEDKITHLENVCRVLNRAMAEGHDNKDIKEEVTELSNKLASVDTRVSPLEKKVASLEGRTRGLENTVAPLQGRTAGLEKKVASLEGRTRGLENKVAPLQGRTAGLEKKVASLEGRMHGLENKVEPLQGRTEGLEKKLAPLEKRNSDVVKSQVKVFLDTKNGQLITEQYITLSKCVDVRTNGGCLDTSSGRVKLSVPGNYLVHLSAHQFGEGEIKFSLDGDYGCIGHFGQTQTEYPLLRSSIAFSVGEPVVMWIEASRLEGEATIERCSLYIRFMGYL